MKLCLALFGVRKNRSLEFFKVYLSILKGIRNKLKDFEGFLALQRLNLNKNAVGKH